MPDEVNIDDLLEMDTDEERAKKLQVSCLHITRSADSQGRNPELAPLTGSYQQEWKEGKKVQI